VSDAGPRESSLARIAFVVYVLLTVYASLHPLEGWRAHGLSPFEYLAQPWPRHVTGFDMTVNVLGYLPYGLLCVVAFYARLRGVAAFSLAVSSAAMLSLLLEAAQTYLPARFSSNLDVACNVAGGALGAGLGLALAPWLLEHGPLKRMRTSGFLPGAEIDLGLVLVGLWLFIQLNPATTLLFGAGNLRDLFAGPEGRARPPEFFVLIEALTSGANLVSVTLLLSALSVPGRAVRLMVLALVAAALAIKTAATALLMRAEQPMIWLTPGAELGLFFGLALALAAVGLPRTARLALAAVLLMAATVLVNLAPPNPYFAASLKLWQQGHFLNFNGLTRLVTIAWPFAALGYFIFLASRRREPPPQNPVG
jgi:VanZ family protein